MRPAGFHASTSQLNLRRFCHRNHPTHQRMIPQKVLTSSRNVDECKPLTVVEAVPTDEEHNAIGEAAAVSTQEQRKGDEVIVAAEPETVMAPTAAHHVPTMGSGSSADAEKEAEGALSDASTSTAVVTTQQKEGALPDESTTTSTTAGSTPRTSLFFMDTTEDGVWRSEAAHRGIMGQGLPKSFPFSTWLQPPTSMIPPSC